MLALRSVALFCASAFALVSIRPAAAAGQEKAHFTLSTALEALRAHPALQSAEYEVEAAKADQVATKLWQNPSASFSWTPGVRASSYDRAGYIYYGVTQFLELSNTPGARKEAANLVIAATRAERQAVWVDLALSVEDAMIDVVTAERKMTLIGQALGLLTQAADVVEKRVLAGGSPRYDLTRIGVTVANAHADLDEGRAAHARAWAELHAAVGPGMEKLRGTPDYPLEIALVLPEGKALLAVLERQRPDLLAASKRAEAAHAQITVAKRSVWSGMAVSALGGFGAAPRQIDVGVGLTSALPVIDHGQGTITAAQRRAQQAESYRDALLMPAALRIVGMRQEALARQEALDAFTKRAVASGDEMLQEAQAGYLAGRFSILELADAYSAWRESRLRAIDLAASARKAEVELERLVGVSLREL